MEEEETDKAPSEIDEEWMNLVQNETVAQIDQRIAELTKLEQANRAAMKEDPEILQKKEELKNLSAPYREDTKGYKARMKFIMSVLETKGKV